MAKLDEVTKLERLLVKKQQVLDHHKQDALIWKSRCEILSKILGTALAKCSEQSLQSLIDGKPVLNDDVSDAH